MQPAQSGFLLGVWAAGYVYTYGLATISGGVLLTLLKLLNGGDAFGAYSSMFAIVNGLFSHYGCIDAAVGCGRIPSSRASKFW